MTHTIAALTIFGLTAGLLTTLALEEVIPQAHERGEPHGAASAFVLAFIAFIAISSYL
jgi:zinc transporter ZupT